MKAGNIRVSTPSVGTITGAQVRRPVKGEELSYVGRREQMVGPHATANVNKVFWSICRGIVARPAGLTPNFDLPAVLWDKITENVYSCFILRRQSAPRFRVVDKQEWTPMAGNASGDVMQALSHFSYHVSYGQLLLCDLQGGVYQNGFILSDPVIMSPTQNYGPLDLGIDGINSFFSRHRCGFFCDKQWTKPPSTGPAVIPIREGSSMTS
ncbi:hypothetical protein WAI453_012912 [Rhynchosporium graminicola]